MPTSSLRRWQAANLMITLCLSSGSPMLTAGDERGRTQGGNNNAYCQDDEVSWVDWRADGVRTMGMFVSGDPPPPGPRGVEMQERLADASRATLLERPFSDGFFEVAKERCGRVP